MNISEDYIVYVNSSGKRSKKYRSFCRICSFDKGYIRKSRLDTICHSCNAEKAKETGKNWAGKSKEVLEKIKVARKVQKIEHSPETKLKIAISNERTKAKLRKENNTFKGSYDKKKIRERVGHLIRTRIKKRDVYYSSNINIGYLEFTFKQFVDRFESLFQPGMTWDNYGYNGWHIDHIVPVSCFDYNSVECNEYKNCWKLSNLQPLWKLDNIKKSNKQETL